jgi:uncharacterized protein (DUF2252 family)
VTAPAAASAGARDIPPGVRRRARRLAWVYLIVAVALIGWTVFLALSLPKENLEHHYRLTWTGFDLILVLAIYLTAHRAFRLDARVIYPASLEVAARGNGFGGKDRRGIVTAAVARYRQAMRAFAGMTNLDVWYAHADLNELRAQFDAQMKERQRKTVEKGMAKARTRDSMQEVAKLTRIVDGRPRIISEPPLLVPVAELLPKEQDLDAFWAQLKDLIARYRRTLETDRRYLLEQYEAADMARKVVGVGVGSVGTRCWIILMLGRDESDPLFLQVKEAQASVFSRFAGASKYANMGQRVVAGQRLMQASSDIFLGWQRAEAGLDGKQRDFYIRQLRDWKYSIDIEALVPRGMRTYGELCGWTLARAHARSGDRIAIAAYLGSSNVFDQAITQFAAAYADQNERDHQSLLDAVASGRLTAERDL